MSITNNDITNLENIVKKIRTHFETHSDRKVILLEAVYTLLKECDSGIYVRNILSMEVNYGGTEGDGYSLMNDIAFELGMEDE